MARDIQQSSPRSGLASTDLNGLLPAVYDELRVLAHAVLEHSRAIDPTCTTSLINDAYVRLAQRGVRFRDRGHFLCIAARAMRLVLIDRARRMNAQKRGARPDATPLDDDIAAPPNGPDLLAVEDALTRLATFDDRKARIVEMRFFGGLSIAEAADALQLSEATVKREWTLARAWLHHEIGGRGGNL